MQQYTCMQSVSKYNRQWLEYWQEVHTSIWVLAGSAYIHMSTGRKCIYSYAYFLPHLLIHCRALALTLAPTLALAPLRLPLPLPSPLHFRLPVYSSHSDNNNMHDERVNSLQ